MSRIYKSEVTGARYKGVNTSVKFNPVKAQSSDKQLQGWKQAREQDRQAVSREINREQQQENLELESKQRIASSAQKVQQGQERDALATQQLFDSNTMKMEHGHERAQMQVDFAALQAKNNLQAAKIKFIGSAVNSLLEVGGSVMKLKLEAAEKLEAANEANEAIGLGSTFFDNEPVDTSSVDAENTAIKAESTAINNSVADLRDSNDPIDQKIASDLQQSTFFKQISRVNGNLDSAAAMIEPVLLDASAQGLIRPGADGYLDAQRIVQKFAEKAGLRGLDRIKIAEKFKPAALNAIQNTVRQVTAQHVQKVQAANKAEWSGIVSNLADSATFETVGTNFDEAVDAAVHGNIGYNGVNSTAATAETLQEYVNNLNEDGRTEAIRRLRDHRLSNGILLGKEYDHIFDKAERASRTSATQLFNLKNAEEGIRIQNVKERFINREITVQQAVNELRSTGTLAGQQAAALIFSKGNNYDPNAQFSLRTKTLAQIQSMKDEGLITQEQQDVALKAHPEKVWSDKVTEALAPVKKGLDKFVLDGSNKATISPDALAEMAFRMDAAYEEMHERLMSELAADPSLVNKPNELGRLVTSIRAEVMSQDKYTLHRKEVGAPQTFKAPMYSTSASIGQISENFTTQSVTDIRKTMSTFGHRISLDADTDSFITPAQLEADVQSLMTTGKVSNRSSNIAAFLDMPDAAFIDAQLKRYGKPSLTELRLQSLNPGATPSQGGLATVSMRQGYAKLKALGFTDIGAAYLAGNIQQESGWRGQRTWGEVMGDGSDRNGGLISWMDDAERNHFRLRNIESYLGKPITEATVDEQLQAMKWEMKKRNPWAYKVFTQPGFGARDLRAASVQYWGYGHEGKRFTYAQQLLN